jgi:2',3'-cyclic-nucleotide 2'-phosphodiesterase/3'-nucleotidase
MLRADGAGRDGVVLIDSGDMWTGPAVSTLLQGAPVMEAFNKIGYRAAAVGNHDFDFGIEILERRSKEAHFPLLAANLTLADGSRPSWAKPFQIVESGSVKL